MDEREASVPAITNASDAESDSLELQEWGKYLPAPVPEQTRTVIVLVDRPSESVQTQQQGTTEFWGEPVAFLPYQPSPGNILPLRKATDEIVLKPPFYHVGAAYYEGSDGYYFIDRNGDYRRFTDFLIKICSREIVQKIDGTASEMLEIELTNDHGKKENIRIPIEDWSELAGKIERSVHSCLIFSDEFSNIRERFKRLVGILLKNAKIPKHIIRQVWGWGELLPDGSRKFYHGGMSDCRSEKKLLPPLTEPAKRFQILQEAWGHVQNLGPMNVVIPLVLYSLQSYMDALFTDAGYPVDFCEMMIGDSGFLKTSTAREIFAPAAPKEKRIYSVRGTEAAFNVLHEQSYDDTLVVDDYNKEGNASDIKRKERIIRALIRTYSDKTPRAKYGGNDNVKQYAIRGGCVFTGETRLLSQVKSGELRYIKIVFRSRMNGEELAHLQKNPTLWLAFTSEFIRFVEKNYVAIVEFIRKAFDEGRSDVRLEEPRLIDIDIHLRIVVDVLAKFLLEENIMVPMEAEKWIVKAKESVYEVIAQQGQDAKTEEPFVRYLVEFWNLLGTGALKIATSLEDYLKNQTAFVGYQADDIYMVKKDEAYKRIREAFFERDETLPISTDDLSKSLRDHGITKCDKGSCLKKAPSQIKGRPRMLALIIKECQKIIEEESKNE